MMPSQAANDLLGPGLGSQLPGQLDQELEDRRKKLNTQMDPNPMEAVSAVASLFPALKNA